MTYYASEVQGAAMVSVAGFSTPKKNKAQKWISTNDLLRQQGAGAALISGAGFSTPKKINAQNPISNNCLQHQRGECWKFHQCKNNRRFNHRFLEAN